MEMEPLDVVYGFGDEGGGYIASFKAGLSPHEKLAVAVIGRALLDNDIDGIQPWIEFMGGSYHAIKRQTPAQRQRAGLECYKLVTAKGD
jgi:hypothetical protein